jgi:hypothetical protein
MTKLMIALLASCTLVAAIPAVAQAHDDDDWNNGGATYSQFDSEYQHIWQMIQHGVSDGSYSRWQAASFYRQMRTIRARAYWEEQNGEYDAQDTQAQLVALHDRLHVAHERGHDRLDNQFYRWGDRGYNNGDQRQHEYYGWRQY